MGKSASLSMVLCVMLTSAVPVKAEQKQSLEEMRWMIGSWEQRGDRSTVRETWRKLHADAYRGSGVTIRNNSGEANSEESMLLTVMSGEIFYFAKVDQHALPIAFRLVDSSANHAVFENRDHDFPKRLAYKRKSSEEIEVHVSDAADKGFTLRFRRSSE